MPDILRRDHDLPAAAAAARRAGDRPEAERLYRAVLDAEPRHPGALLSLAALCLQRGAVQEAQLLLVRGCGVAPGDPEMWDGMGIALMLGGDAAGAESAFARAQALAPADAGIAIRRAEAALAAGEAEAELVRAAGLADADPCNPAPLVEQAVLLRGLGRGEEAAGLLEAAAALAPRDPLVLRCFGEVLMDRQQARAATAVLAAAAALAPEDAELANNHAAALIRVQRHREARDVLRGVIARHGETQGVLCNLANALVSLGAQREGLAAARRAAELAPGSFTALRAVANALAYHPEADGAGLLAAQRAAGACIARAPALPPAPPRGARLRVGLLSASLRTHPVGWLTIAGFEALDPRAIELVCFGQAPSDDPMQRRFAAVAAAWHGVAGQSPARVARAIRAAGIDVLIDMGGHGDQGMMAACALRPAPVQVKWVGAQAHSSGLAEMDWFLTDRWETPPGFERFYSERLWRMPDGYVCYSPPAYAPDAAALPALAAGRVSFGCFNNLAKITPAVVAAWARILAEVPGARLVLKCHQLDDAGTRDALRAAFAAHGTDPARLDLRGASPHRELLAAYADIDIVLDPFPYTGGLTTCEALWMGVPTVCLAGETFAARHSTSHMANIGLADWSCTRVEDYIAQAVRRAADLPALAAMRAGLRARMAASPLCDAPRFGRHLHAALLGMWEARGHTTGEEPPSTLMAVPVM